MTSKVGETALKAYKRPKIEATQTMKEAGFTLSKRHSNVRALEVDDVHEELKEMSARVDDST